jgi:hypothetical protein
VHQRTPTQTRHLREFPKALRYNSPDCPVYTGQCPVLQGRAPQELASFGKQQRLLRYNSPDMSGVHRTIRCNNGQWLLRRQRLPADALNARQRAQKSGTPMLAHRTLYSTCLVHHRTSRRAQRQSSNGRNPNGRVTWLAHRTCPVLSHPVLKVNRMRTMYVPGSVIHVHGDYINDSS